MKNEWMKFVAAPALAALMVAAGSAQTRAGDADQDGVPDRQDHCPQTPRGGFLIVHGCSAMEFARSPELLVDRTLAALDNVRAGLGSGIETAQAAQHLSDARILISSAAEQMRAAKICEAGAGFGRAESKLQLALGLISGLVENRNRVLLQSRTGKRGDVEKPEIEAAFMRVFESEAKHAIGNAMELGEFVRRSCAAVRGSLAVRGKVTAKDDAMHRITLDSGQVLALAEVYFDKPLIAGQSISATGTAFSDGTGTITSYQWDSAAPAPTPQPPNKCIEFRIAPIQPMLFGGPYVQHDASAYAGGYGILLLENGMHVAAAKLSCPPSLTAYSLKIDVIAQSKTVTIATGLGSNDKPVSLPAQTVPLFQIKVTHYASLCILGGGSCSNPVQIAADTYSATLKEPGYYSAAVYDKTVFEVTDNGIAGDFQSAKVTGLTLSGVPADANATFHAEGYQVNNGQSSKPNVLAVGQNQPFAIYETDFYDPDDLFPEQTTGVDKPSGLQWPHISGTRNGKTFWYSTKLPSIVRDRISTCATSPDCYYRLPFGSGPRIQSKGNSDDPVNAHGPGQAFAFDMLAPQNTTLVAARGGKVVLVEEADWLNKANYPPGHPYFGNYIWIRHEDGTYAVYFHLPQNGAISNYGDKVHRGDAIAKVGNTGNSSEPHVHFEVVTCSGCPSVFPDPPSGASYNTASKKSRFNLKVMSLVTFAIENKNCYIPRAGDVLFPAQ